ncbi:MAG: hypothetical protein IPJ73_22010 [Zoogloea sp.]|nr:hypothetical protein [Zoogloea sp.]
MPADSDLLLNLTWRRSPAGLPLTVPAGREITLYYAAQDLDDLFRQEPRPHAHLMQAVAHVQGYGFGSWPTPRGQCRDARASLWRTPFLSPIWLNTAPAPGRRPCHRRFRGELADIPLRRDFCKRLCHLLFGLQIRESEDGSDVGLDVQAPERLETLH